MLCIKVIDKNGLTINVRRDENKVHLPLFHEYQEGDQIIIEVSAICGIRSPSAKRGSTSHRRPSPAAVICSP